MQNNSSNRRKFLMQSALAVGALASGNAFGKTVGGNESVSLRKPKRLKTGDLVALTAPAGAIFNEDSIQKATVAIEAMGFRVKHGETLHQKFGYLAGKDAFRANELQNLLSDKSVSALVAMRGGWGSSRLLPYFDFTQIIDSPKIISGFSDITSLLLAFYKQVNHVGFHGPVGNSTWEGFTSEQFLRMVRDAEQPVLSCTADSKLNTIHPGKAEGILLGGNLTMLCHLMGTGFSPDYTNAILFLEETEEEPYAVDRMLTQLELAGVLQKISGVIIGQCTKCDAEEPEKSFTLQDVFDQKFKTLGKPVFAGAPIGHIKDKWTVPLGVRARMNADEGTLTLLESAVV